MSTQSRTIISIRPGLIHPGLIEELYELAKGENRTLNNYVCNLLSNTVKSIKANEKITGLTAGGKDDSENT